MVLVLNMQIEDTFNYTFAQASKKLLLSHLPQNMLALNAFTIS